jgi:regulator of sigma E protease
MSVIVTILVFIIVLAVLVFVHELGHFLIAKACGVRVDEFGLGFPPRIAGIKKGETIYSINAIPFGGFVKIFGENGDSGSRSFAHLAKWKQVSVLIAGVTSNLLFAWIILSAAFLWGMPTSLSGTTPSDLAGKHIDNVHIAILSITAKSPADKAHLQAGDTIVSLSATSALSDTLSGNNLSVEYIQDFIKAHTGPIIFSILRSGKMTSITVTPEDGVIAGQRAVGIALDEIGSWHTSFFESLKQGGILFWHLLSQTAVGFATLFHDLFIGQAHLSEVSGPIGIAKDVGDARAMGFVYVITFTALISINLALINLIPIPALDGGRILFVIIEAIRRKAIPAHIAVKVNTISFIALICLIVIISAHDIYSLI